MSTKNNPPPPRAASTTTSTNTTTTTTNTNSNDPIIGLDVCGRVFYCHVSTLCQSSPYFATRFSGNFNADICYRDKVGRSVYFLERCPQTFQYIFRYILTGRPQTVIPAFDKDPTLRRALREEADYFGLAELSNALATTRTFTPQESNRGVLYWLGTSKGKAGAVYENPYKIGAIHVGGWVDNLANNHKAMFELARSAACRANFVQYQQPVTLRWGNRHHHHPGQEGGGRGSLASARISIESYNYLLWCDHGMERLPVVIDLKSVALKPSHYSLRVSQCYGMQGDWNFDGSVDGTNWDTLHAARGDDRLCLSESSDIITKLDKCFPINTVGVGPPPPGRTDDPRSEALLRLIEQDYRHCWEIRPPPQQFYRYFRIIGAGSELDIRDNCLHGEGIELFGDVYEE